MSFLSGLIFLSRAAIFGTRSATAVFFALLLNLSSRSFACVTSDKSPSVSQSEDNSCDRDYSPSSVSA